MTEQRGTPIPALFNQFYKFIQNPSTVSVETFKRMVDTDDTIGSGVDFLTTCLAARIGMYQHPSQEITDFVNRALGKIQGGFGKAVKELLSASWAGFSVMEKVWTNTDDGWIVKELVSLPPGTLLFETNRTGELTDDGILQYQRNYNPANLAFGSGSLFGFSNGGISGARMNDPYAKFGDFPFPIRTANTYSYLSIRIPIEKCIHYSFDASGNFGNPYGRSLLRRAYKWYVMEGRLPPDALGGSRPQGDAAHDRLCRSEHDAARPITRPRRDEPESSRQSRTSGRRARPGSGRGLRNIHNRLDDYPPGQEGPDLRHGLRAAGPQR